MIKWFQHWRTLWWNLRKKKLHKNRIILTCMQITLDTVQLIDLYKVIKPARGRESLPFSIKSTANYYFNNFWFPNNVLIVNIKYQDIEKTVWNTDSKFYGRINKVGQFILKVFAHNQRCNKNILQCRETGRTAPGKASVQNLLGVLFPSVQKFWSFTAP